jgi:Hint domain
MVGDACRRHVNGSDCAMAVTGVGVPNVIQNGDGTETVSVSHNGTSSATLTLIATNTATGEEIIVGTESFSVTGGGNRAVTVEFASNTISSLPAGTYAFRVTTSTGITGSSTQPISVVCFASGTLIATVRGEVAVEDLRVGDLVVTAHGGAPLQPIVWLGHTKVNVARQRNRAAVAPILIRAGALADGVPYRDLRVSPEHAMFLDGRLVPARHLVNGTTIAQELWCPEVTYWHVELPAHGLLVAEGAVSESYFDDGSRKHFDNYGITTLFKDFASERHNGRYAEAACYPLLEDGPLLGRIRARIDARAAKVVVPAQRSA